MAAWIFRSASFCALAAWLLLSVGTAQAQELAEHPTMKAGDTWTFQYHNRGDKKNPYEYTNSVIGSVGESTWIYGESKEEGARYPKYVWRYDPKRTLYAERFAHDPSAPHQAGERNLSRLKNDDLMRWPLKVGDTFKARTHSASGHTDWEIKVEAFEKITVPAGTFDAFRMKRQGYWYNTNSGNSGRAETVVWFSPDAKANVKTVFKDWARTNSLWNDEETVLIKWAPSVQ